MYYRVLGPLTVDNGDGPVRLGGPRQQTVLAVLLCHVGQAVPQDALIEAVWSGAPPKAARATLQGYVYGLRQELGSEQIRRQGGGYRVDLDSDAYDALQFEHLVGRGRHCLRDDPTRARSALAEALDLWYGTAFGGLDDNPVVMTEAARLRELRLVAVEHRIEAELLLGNHDGVVSELRTLVREHPLRERFRAQQMIALYRSGRQAEALAAYQRARELLGEELGLDPSSELRELEQRILAQDPALLVDGDGRDRSRPAARPVQAASSIADAAAPGRSLRGYELRNALGEGDFGTVLRAFQPSVGREVAVKVIRPEYANRPVFVQRFEREAQIVAQLEHPHIVPLFDYWRDPHGAYLVMPLLRGGSLAVALRRGGWNLAPALRAVEQVGGALAHAHRRGVVHRDVKPGNVLLDEEGNAYLSDFGIAVRLSDDSEVPVTTSLAYVPPEELRGEPQTPKSDLFALGVLTYQLVTGVAPPASGALPAVTSIRPELPAALDDVLARATDDSPARRHDRVEAFLRDLRRSVGADVVEITAAPRVTQGDEPIRNPYKGLRAFRETDAADFFGRDAMIDELLEAVTTHNLVTVVGPSGSGKSSLVRAGLVPRLRAGAVPGSRDWLVTDMFPGSYPFEELEAALRRIAVDTHDSLLEELLDPHGLLRVTKQLVPDDDSTVLLVVDQFEELFSAVRSDQARRLFLDNLTSVAADERTRVRVVLTLRADFFDRPLQHAEFAAAMAPGVVTVGAPSRGGIAQAIAAPARGVGVDLEPGLVGRIIADVEDQPGGLPLLQYALTELFSMRDGEQMTVAAYERTGGVTSSLGRRAEELYESLPDGARQAARNLFLRLVTVEEGTAETRRRAALAELQALATDQDAMDHVLHEFGSFRLLSFDRDPTTRGPTVEVAHEALLREWDRLRSWVDERREGLILSRRLAMATSDWEDADRDPSFLLRGGRLEQMAHWREQTDIVLTDAEADYLDTSLEQRDQRRNLAQRRRRATVVSLLVVVAVVTLLALTAIAQRSMAQQEARDARARELAGESTLALEEDPQRALLIALEAVAVSRDADRDPLPEVIGALQQAVQEVRLVQDFDVGGPMATLGGDDPAVVTGDASGVVVRSLLDDGLVELPASWEEPAVATQDDLGLIAVGHGPDATAGSGVAVHQRDGELVATLPGPSRHTFFSVALAPSGTGVAGISCPVNPNRACDAPPVVSVWNDHTATREEVEVDGRPGDLAFLSDRRLAVVTTDPTGVAVLDLDAATATFVEVDDPPLAVLAVDPAGRRAAVTSTAAEEVTVVDLETEDVVTSFTANREQAIAWSPDGTRLAVAGNAGVVRVFDVASGTEQLQLRGATENLFAVTFTPDGDLVLAATLGHTWAWDVTQDGPAAVGAIGAPRSPVFHFALSPDEGTLSFTSPGQGVRVLDVGSGTELAAAPDVLSGIDVGVSQPDSGFTMIGGLTADGTSAIRRLPDLSTVREVADCTNPLAFSEDGTLAFVSGDVCPDERGDDGPSSRVLRIADGEVVAAFDHDWVFVAGFNPGGPLESGRYLALTDQAAVEIHDLHTGQEVARVTGDAVGSPEAGHLSVIFDRSGRYLTSGMSDGRVWVIDLPAVVSGTPVSEALVFSRVTHTGAAPVPALTTDGTLATAGFDGLVRLWDVASGDLVTEFRTDMSNGLPILDLTADEGTLLYTDGGDVVRRFPLDPDRLVEVARSLVTRELTPDECARHLGPQGCRART